MIEPSLLERCEQLLEELWESLPEEPTVQLPESIVEDIETSLNSATKSYRYVLPTQVLAKLADPSLDVRSIQIEWGVAGAFDARTIAKRIIVPFDRRLHSVLGGSGDPYVNNPLRDQAVIPGLRSNKRDKAGWDALCRVLSAIEESDVEADAVFNFVLQTIRKRLETVHVVYPVPNRSSLADCLQAIQQLLARRSGGVRFEAIVAALFETIGSEFGIFASARRTSVNVADVQAGVSADVECLSEDGNVIMAVEAKDRQLTIREVEDKLPLLREGEIREAFFLSSVGTDPSQENEIDSLISKEFSSGQNLYVLKMEPFQETILALIGEAGRRRFLEAVGKQLDEFGRLEDRQEWAHVLQQI